MLKNGVNFYATNGCNSYTGYGRMELGIASGLQSLTPLWIAPKRDCPTLVIGNAEWLKAPHIRHTKRVLITMSESSKVSRKWVDLINDHATAVFVPCKSLVDVYKSSGVCPPVISIGCGVYDASSHISVAWDGITQFQWLGYTYGDLRKGADLTIEAFKRLFNDDPKHHLTIKARDGENVGWLTGLRDPQITIVFGQQSDDDWHRLLARSHAFIFPSRGEGFGMPPREATMAGLPTIATNWLGLDDVDQWGIPIDVRTFFTSQFEQEEANAIDSMWAQPDINHLMQQMQWVYNNYDQACAIAEAGSKHIKTHNNWFVIAGNIMLGLEQVL